MPISGRLRGVPAIHLAGWRAARIPDPVRRLRYLQIAVRPRPRRWPRILAETAAALAGLLLAARPVSGPTLRVRPAAVTVAAPLPTVWQVERSASAELFSNGLHVETALSIGGAARRYRRISRAVGSPEPEWRSEPAGIVFHSSESDLASFDPERNSLLRRLGSELLSYIRSRGLYNYVVDRFGRVFRIVEDAAVAAHAGYSAWADEEWIYVNLNPSFLGVCFEARSGAADSLASSLTPAQVRSGRALVEMLRSRYGIAPANAVTHGQVSLNPSNWRIGYHTDWSGPFPFAELGLPDNHARIPPSVAILGFLAGPDFRRLAGPSLRASLEEAERELGERATAGHFSVAQYRAALRRNYRSFLASQLEKP